MKDEIVAVQPTCVGRDLGTTPRLDDVYVSPGESVPPAWEPLCRRYTS